MLPYLHGVDAHGSLEALDALLELPLAQVQQGLGALGAGATVLGQLPGAVVVLVLARHVAQETVECRRLLLFQLASQDLFRLAREKAGNEKQ